jgi:hypothetical protein
MIIAPGASPETMDVLCERLRRCAAHPRAALIEATGTCSCDAVDRIVGLNLSGAGEDALSEKVVRALQVVQGCRDVDPVPVRSCMHARASFSQRSMQFLDAISAACCDVSFLGTPTLARARSTYSNAVRRRFCSKRRTRTAAHDAAGLSGEGNIESGAFSM